MVIVQPYEYNKNTAIKERKNMVEKINEIIEVLNNLPDSTPTPTPTPQEITVLDKTEIGSFMLIKNKSTTDVQFKKKIVIEFEDINNFRSSITLYPNVSYSLNTEFYSNTNFNKDSKTFKNFSIKLDSFVSKLESLNSVLPTTNVDFNVNYNTFLNNSFATNTIKMRYTSVPNLYSNNVIRFLS